MFYYKKKHRKHGKKNKGQAQGSKQSTKKKYWLTEKETEAMFEQVRKNLSCAVRVRSR